MTSNIFKVKKGTTIHLKFAAYKIANPEMVYGIKITRSKSSKISHLDILSDVGHLKVPKCEIFHLFDFNDFYGIKSL